MGAGLLTVPLLPLTAAFFCGRVVSYAIYVGAAAATSQGLGTIVKDTFSSPVGVAGQLAMLGLLVLLVRVDWSKRLRGRAAGRGKPNAPGPISGVTT